MSCPADDVLHGFVEGLLSADELRELERHLESCTACRDVAASASAAVTVIGDTDPGADDGTASREPTPVAGRIGRYAVLGHLGAGAMGIVLRAYDPKLEREVALKILRGAMSPDSRTRLVREAKAMAKLNHPNVVGLYDVEIEPDCVVVVMELVRGLTLGGWMAGKPQWPAVLEHFGQAGRGLAAAHAAGLLHRDFKPANVLVGDDGRVRVTDFGIARAQANAPSDDSGPTASPTQDPALTEAGVVVGTPAYMAPEQHRGLPLTTAADQYAFATALFEALTGGRPHQGLPTQALTEAKLRGPPTWPRDTGVPAHVSEAVCRALAPEPEDRFPSMDTMLRALASRASKARRNGVAAAAVAVAAIAGLASAGASESNPDQRCSGGDAQLADAWTPALHAHARDAFLKTELPYAQRAWDHNGSRLERYATDWISTYADACQATTVRRAQSEAAMDLRMACLHRARTALGATVNLLSTADADIVARAGSMVEALPSLARCSDLSALDADLDPPSAAQAPAVDKIRVEITSAKTRRLAGRYAAARQALDDVRTPLDQTDYEPVRTEFLLEDALLAELESRYIQAADRLKQAIQLGSKWGQWDEVRLAARMSIFVAARRGEFDESMAIVSLSRGLADASADPADVAEVHATLGAALLLHGRAIDAERELRTALKGLALAKGDSNRRVARVRANLAAALVGQGRHKEAIVQFNEQIAVTTDLLGPAHPDIARTRQTLGNAQHRLGHLDAAEREHLAALRGRKLAFGEDHPEVADSLASLSAVHIDQGRYQQAETEARAALEISERHHGRGNRASLVPASHLARILSDQSNYQAAKLAYARVIGDTISAFGEDSVAVALQRGALGHTLQEAGELQAAEVELRAALRVRMDKLGPAHRQTVENRLALARCLFDQGQVHEAYLQYQQTLAALESTGVAASADLATTLSRYGAALLDGGRLQEAVAHLERSVSIFEALPDQAPRAPDAYFSLAQARLAGDGDGPEVLAPARRARASLQALGPAGAKRLAVVDAWIAALAADGG